MSIALTRFARTRLFPISGRRNAIVGCSAEDFERHVNTHAPLARYLVVILYSREQMQREGDAVDADWGVVGCLATMEPQETPLAPITMMRNALGVAEGGSGVPLDRVHAVGDSMRDIEAALAAGCKPVLVRTGNGRKAEKELGKHRPQVAVYDDLAAFVSALIATA